MTADPARTVGELATADLGRRSFLTSAVYSVLALSAPLAAIADAVGRSHAAVAAETPRRVGMADVDGVRIITSAFNDVDERLGGEHGRAAVVTYLAQDVAALCRGTFATEAVRRAMFSSAAQVAWLAAWKSHDAGKESLAQRYYIQALSLAQRGEENGHPAWILRSLAHHAMDVRRPDRSVDLAQAAWDHGRGRVDVGTSAQLALTLARAHAYSGDRRQALHWLNQGEGLIDKRIDAASGLWWAGIQGPAENIVTSHSAKTFAALGDYAKAEPITARAAARWNPESHPRVRALTLARVGDLQAAQGHVDQACATWSEALGPLLSTHSARARDAVVTMSRTLGRTRHKRVPAAQELIARIAN